MLPLIVGSSALDRAVAGVPWSLPAGGSPHRTARRCARGARYLVVAIVLGAVACNGAPDPTVLETQRLSRSRAALTPDGLACPAPEQLGPTVAVFGDAPENCFEAYSSDGMDPVQGAVVHTGAAALALDPSYYNDLALTRSGLRASYTGLTFWINGGPLGGQTIALSVSSRDATVARGKLSGWIGGSLPADTWVNVHVPFSTRTSGDWIEIRLWGPLSRMQDVIFVDDVALEAADAGSCDGASGEPCSDGNGCNGDELCDGAGHCLGGVTPPLDDGNPCTVDTCDPTLGVNHGPAPQGTSCISGATCGDVGVCDGAGTCVATGTATELRVYGDAVEACFDDWSNSVYDLANSEVVHAGARSIRFDPGAWSTVAFDRLGVLGGFNALEFWVHGGSAGGQSIEAAVYAGAEWVADVDVGTVLGHPIAANEWSRVLVPFSASSAPGEVYIELMGSSSAAQPTLYIDDIRLATTASAPDCAGKPAGTSCSDGNPCNGEETCDGAGACVAGAPPVLDDGNPCTLDTCDPVAGVTHVPVASETSCSDGNPCNGSEVCDGQGTCVRGPPPSLDDGNLCTADRCDPVLGIVHEPVAAGTSCSDGNVCNGSEVCDAAGRCTPGAPLVLDDGDACTTDSCDPIAGVLHTTIPGCVDVLPNRPRSHRR